MQSDDSNKQAEPATGEETGGSPPSARPAAGRRSPVRSSVFSRVWLGVTLFVLVLAGGFVLWNAWTAVKEDGDSVVADATFQETVEAIFSDAEVDTDDNFGKELSEKAVAPIGLRNLLSSWEKSDFYRLGIAYRYQDGRVALTWSTSLRVPEDGEDARPKLIDRMRACGFDETTASEFSTRHWAKHLRLEDSDPQQTRAFRRAAGGTIEEVVAEGLDGGLVGGDKYETEIKLYWTVSRAYRGDAPTMESLSQVSELFTRPNPPERDLSLFDLVRGEPVFGQTVSFPLSPNASAVCFGGLIPADKRPEIETELKRLGFYMQRADSVGETQQFSWRRDDDFASASITPFEDEGRINFAYRAPTRERRQVVGLDQLAFDNPRDADLMSRLHVIASGLAQPQWSGRPLGGWKDTGYFAWWCSVPDEANRWTYNAEKIYQRPDDRELHTITLRANRSQDTGERIGNVELAAMWCPRGAGWSARLGLRTLSNNNELHWSLYFNYYEEGKTHASGTEFFPYHGLARYSVTRDFAGTRYNVSAINPLLADGLSDATVKRLAASPDAFRDEMIAWIDALEHAVEQGVRSGEAIQGAFLIEEAADGSLSRANLIRPAIARSRDGGDSDLRITRAGYTPQQTTRSPITLAAAPRPPDLDRPPQPSDRPLTDEEKEQIVQEARTSLDERRQLLLQHYREIHAALMRTFPLGELLSAADEL